MSRKSALRELIDVGRWFAARGCPRAGVASVRNLLVRNEPLEPRVLLSGDHPGFDFPAVPPQFDVENSPSSVIAVDVDGDGAMDLVSASWNASGTVSVLRNLGDGTFADQVTYPVGGNPYSVISTDVDHDHKPDLVTVNWSSGNVSVLRNLGNGTFAAQVTYAVGNGPQSVTAADVDGDHAVDLVACNSMSGNVSVLRNLGSGTFADQLTYPAGTLPLALTAADVDHDGAMDLAVSNYANEVSVLRNLGNGTFAAGVTYPVGIDPLSVTAADLDGNGAVDLVTSNYNSANVSVLLNLGNGTFASHVTYPVGSGPWTVTSADVDGDGAMNLLTANFYTSDVSVLRSLGDGTFAAQATYSVASPTSVAAADLNGDGLVDLAATNYFANKVSVLRNLALAGGTVGNDILHVRVDPQDASQLLITCDTAGAGVRKWHVTADQLSVDGLMTYGGDDTIILDFANGPILTAGGLSIDAGDDNDILRILGTAGADTIVVNHGQAAFGGNPITFLNAESIELDGASGNDVVSIGADAAVTFIATQHLASLSLTGTAQATLAAGGDKLLDTAVLSMAAGTRLNLKQNDILIGTQDLNSFHGLITSGAVYTDSTTSPVAGKTTTLGYAKGNSPAIAYMNNIFDGEAFTGAAVLVKYTFVGDANLDGSVDGSDVALWAQNFSGALGLNPANPRTWTQGDWNGDGSVDGSDVALWAQNFTGALGGGGLGVVVTPLAVAPAAVSDAAGANPMAAVAPNLSNAPIPAPPLEQPIAQRSASSGPVTSSFAAVVGIRDLLVSDGDVLA